MTSADASGLLVEDLRREVERFGVAEEQVRRDHLISHLLAAISRSCADDVIFFGGTALSRTHLAHARLSEDVDLIATSTRREVLPRLVRAVEGDLMRTRGRPSWQPAFTDRDVEPAVLSAAGLQVRLQVLRGDLDASWPVEQVELEQRYSDAPPATLTVPTLASFAGWKTAAWLRPQGAPRPLRPVGAVRDRRARCPGCRPVRPLRQHRRSSAGIHVRVATHAGELGDVAERADRVARHRRGGARGRAQRLGWGSRRALGVGGIRVGPLHERPRPPPPRHLTSPGRPSSMSSP